VVNELTVRPEHREAARRLIDAARTHVPCAPVRELVPEGTLDDAYVIQTIVRDETSAGRRPFGRKIGLTSRAVQQQFGVDQPDFGVLHADMAFGDNEDVPFERLLQPRIEAEVAFVLGRDLGDAPVAVTDVIRATDFVVAAIEIVDSRIADWDISIVDTVADNASSGVFVLGGRPRRLADLDDLREARMELTTGDECVSSGRGAACLGHPINAVVWLANELAGRGEPLREGEVILSGALGPLVPAHRGRSYTASIEGLGSVTANFTASS
jgi:2-keto-4-pentenoate hydratase